MQAKYFIEETGRDWNINRAINNIKKCKIDDKYIQEILYRPFDYRYTYFTNESRGFLAYPVYNTFQHFVHGENYGLIINKSTKKNTIRPFFITNKITDSKILQTKDASAYIFPLFKYVSTSLLGYTKISNLDIDIIRQIKEKVCMDFNDDINCESTFSSLDVLDYIYANLYSDKYFKKYNNLLQNDFPKVPYPKNKEYFLKIVNLGERLRKMHTLENNTMDYLLENYNITYPKEGNNEISKDKIHYENKKIIFNKDKQCFDNVPEEVWDMCIGDYCPAKLWLEKRANYIMNNNDIEHYKKIIIALSETNKIMNEIDKIIEL